MFFWLKINLFIYKARLTCILFEKPPEQDATALHKLYCFPHCFLNDLEYYLLLDGLKHYKLFN